MKKTNLLVAILSTLLTGVAYAGLYRPVPVTIDLDNRVAQGDQYSTRTSADAGAVIGCGIRMIDAIGVPFEFGFCQAAVGPDTQVTCFTQSPELLEVMRSTTSFAFISFSWDENADCTQIGFSTQSFYLPEFKTK